MLDDCVCSSGHVGNVMIVNPLDALKKTPCTPCALLLPSHINNVEQSRCATSQFVPLRVENNLKSVKQQISDYAYELLINIRKEASMSNVVQQSKFCYSASQPNLLCHFTMKANCAQPA